MSTYDALQVFSGDQLITEQLLTMHELTIGRAPECDLVLTPATVSRRHLRLYRTAVGWMVENLSSSAPAQLNQVPLRAPEPLRPGDLLMVGTLRLQLVPGSDAQLTPSPDRIPPVLTVTYGSVRANYPLHLPQVRIGRAPDNQIVIPVATVSRYHAQLEQMADGFRIRDLQSANGLLFNANPISEHQLADGDVIRIADELGNFVSLTFHDPHAAAQTSFATNQLRLDAIELTVTLNKSRQTLLNRISLSLAPRELIALVGGSGAGKSTLLRALSGVRPATHGRVLVNGQDFYANYAAYRHCLGYVPQDDIIYTDLTVAATLRYAARLRLPPTISLAAIDERITAVLEEVQLQPVHNVEVSQLSGGQRKRVSIAVELLAHPTLFFLDEPTTGLDPGLDKRMMTLLRQLADQGRTVVLVTHATANIAVCDKVAFLARGGRLCFYGPPQAALAFFGASSFAEIYARLDQDPTSGPAWEARFAQSPQAHELAATLAAAPSPPRSTGSMPPTSAHRPPRSPGQRQWRILTQRHLERLTRDRSGLLATLFPALLMSILLAIFVPANLLAAGASSLDAQRVLFLLAIAAILLGATSSTRELVKERPIYERERLVNLRLLPYLSAKLVVLGLVALGQSMLLLSVVIWRMDLPFWGALLPAPLELLLGIWLAALSGVSLGLLISAFAATVEQAVSLLPLVMLLQILLAGLIFPLPGSLVPLSYLTNSRWAMDSLGTSMDLNRLYYLSLPAAPPGIRPTRFFVPPTFNPQSYDAVARPRSVYTPEAQRASRMRHLIARWGFQITQTLIWIIGAGLLLQRRDRR